MGLLLYIVALLIKRIIEPVMYIINSIIALFKGEWNQYNHNLAVSLDQYGNGLCQYLFSYIFVKKRGYRFGNIDETISSVLGKNKKMSTLTSLGKGLAYVLDLLDPNHVEDSIDNTEN
jgi:hypothetical protein